MERSTQRYPKQPKRAACYGVAGKTLCDSSGWQHIGWFGQAISLAEIEWPHGRRDREREREILARTRQATGGNLGEYDGERSYRGKVHSNYVTRPQSVPRITLTYIPHRRFRGQSTLYSSPAIEYHENRSDIRECSCPRGDYVE